MTPWAMYRIKDKLYHGTLEDYVPLCFLKTIRAPELFECIYKMPAIDWAKTHNEMLWYFNRARQGKLRLRMHNGLILVENLDGERINTSRVHRAIIRQDGFYNMHSRAL